MMLHFTVPFYKVIFLITQVVVTILTVAYFNQLFHIVMSLVLRKKCWKNAPKDHKYAFVISARDEEAVIGELLDSIKAQDYPAEKLSVFVVADNCTDATAAVAAEKGAIVFQRTDPTLRGKGYALDYAFKKIMSEYGHMGIEGYFIFDADNVASKDFVTQMNKVFDCGEKVIMGFRCPKNYSDNWLAGTSSYMHLREARQINFGRSSLGIGTFTSGTGYLISARYIKEVGGWPYTTTLTEDLEISTVVCAKGGTVEFCPDAIFYDEQPVRFRDFFRQRLRWAKGNHQVFFTKGAELYRSFLRKPSLTKWGMMMHITPLPAFSFIWFLLYTVLGLAWAAFNPMPYEVFNSEFLSFCISNWVYSLIIAYFCSFVLVFQCMPYIDAPKWKQFLYIFLFPFSMYLFVPITIAALFMKVEWKPIQHKQST